MADVEVHLRKRYQCSACARSWSSKRRAEQHAAECIHDPAMRACPTCKHETLHDDGFECMVGAKPKAFKAFTEPDDGVFVPVEQPAPMFVRNCSAWATRAEGT